MRKYTAEEKRKIQSHPLWIKHSGSVPEEQRHLVYPDEAKPADASGKKKVKAPDPVEPQETIENGDSN